MRRLIDADNLEKELLELCGDNPPMFHYFSEAIKVIREQPTSYDVVGVIEAINFKKYFDELYETGLEVANWHLNGDLESFDNFYESALEEGAVKDETSPKI